MRGLRGGATLPGKWGHDLIATPSRVGEAAEVVSEELTTRRSCEMDETVITRNGFERLNAELERMTNDERRQIAERLRQAATSEANRAESADYLGVREDQALLEHRIALLEERLHVAQVVEPQSGDGRIDVGERVRLRDLNSGKRLEVELVGPLESDASSGRISIASPLGQAIVGLRRGQIAEVDAPRGRVRFKVLAVEIEAPGRAA
jgi:transcription elongation factor GreA